VGTGLNLLQLELMHNFNTNTAGTLVFDSDLWQRDVMALAFQVRIAVSLVDSMNGCIN